VPTDKGYRSFVDALLTRPTASAAQQALLETKLQLVEHSVSSMLVQVTDILANMIDYTTIVIMPDIYSEVLKVMHLILVDINKILVVILNSMGINHEFMVMVNDKVSQDDLNKVSKILTEKLAGKSFNALDKEIFDELIKELPELKTLLNNLLPQVHKMINNLNQDKQVLIKGTAKMLKLPEFQNIEMARNILEALEENKLLCNVLSGALNEPKAQVLIGKEHNMEALDNCSIVMTPLQMNNEVTGVIGVLGPKRMAYPVIVPMVQQIGQMIKNFLGKTA
jgi:heat-inducible transcriptional repressor